MHTCKLCDYPTVLYLHDLGFYLRCPNCLWSSETFDASKRPDLAMQPRQPDDAVERPPDGPTIADFHDYALKRRTARKTSGTMRPVVSIASPAPDEAQATQTDDNPTA
ncbi:hypothetical protein E3T55_15175 [Cryobacterium frigoriphilum]|uniref:Transcription factor zinc-finger domain-containing protein n=1 Tax=Cryobacterium frigoriphilum TaxID=1259150 RepID=A0A4R8ZVV6_9MICO|nr:hypothetical protein [Cryobacterium frigoriphilum]TFD47633.1 hypothetical protein E3T55_15175 [Cryobacterium frigoriphilum]